MEVALNSRHMSVPVGFRGHVEEKLARLEKHDHRITRVQVEVAHERNPRQADRAVRVELTAFSKGPLVRAEAAGPDQVAALDLAVDKMAAQMRRAADRRRIHRGRHTPESVRQALAAAPLTDDAAADGSQEPGDTVVDGLRELSGDVTGEAAACPVEVEGDGPLVVRQKQFTAAPMTLEQALYEMELVGHDFYLFVDAGSGCPAVVYRRRGFDYGVVTLAPEA